MRTLLLIFLASLLSVAQDSAWSHPLLDAGPMMGHATETTALVWVRTKRPAIVQGVARSTAKPLRSFLSEPVTTTRASDLCAHLRFKDLPFGTRFRFELRINGQAVEFPWPARFQTQAHWRWREPAPDFTVAIGSCLYVNDPPFDRPGKPYGSRPVICDTIAKAQPDLMLWLGDNVYFREPDWTARSAMVSRYAKSRRSPDLRALLAGTQHYAIWDDHDFGPDNSDWTFPGRRDALSVFHRFWANPAGGRDEAPGIFTRFTWGDAEFFLTDGRYHRRPEHAPNDADKRMFGKVQMRWLLDSLQSSRATFKVVAAGSQILNRSTRYECLADYPVEYAELIEGITTRKIPGVIFVSGDRHHGELLRLDRAGAYPLHDLTTSPLSAGAATARGEEDNPLRVAGSLVTRTRNYGRLRFRGQGEERCVHLELVDRDGELRFTTALRAKELR